MIHDIMLKCLIAFQIHKMPHFEFPSGQDLFKSPSVIPFQLQQLCKTIHFSQTQLFPDLCNLVFFKQFRHSRETAEDGRFWISITDPFPHSLSYSHPDPVLSHLQHGSELQVFYTYLYLWTYPFSLSFSHLHHGSTSPYLLNLFMKYDCVLFLVSLAVFIELIWRLDWRWWSSTELLHQSPRPEPVPTTVSIYFSILFVIVT